MLYLSDVVALNVMVACASLTPDVVSASNLLEDTLTLSPRLE